jgi:hypothetical protein
MQKISTSPTILFVAGVFAMHAVTPADAVSFDECIVQCAGSLNVCTANKISYRLCVNRNADCRQSCQALKVQTIDTSKKPKPVLRKPKVERVDTTRTQKKQFEPKCPAGQVWSVTANKCVSAPSATPIPIPGVR